MEKFLYNAVFFVLIFVAIFSYFYLAFLPIFGDAALYADVANELEKTGKPTFLGYIEPWKPFMFFYIYNIIKYPFKFIFTGPEVFSVPFAAVGVASIVLFYKLVRIFYDEWEAKKATLFFSFIYINFLTFSMPLMDGLLELTIIASIYFYLLYLKHEKIAYLLLGSAFLLISFSVKGVASFVIMYVIAAYIAFEGEANKKELGVFEKTVANIKSKKSFYVLFSFVAALLVGIAVNYSSANIKGMKFDSDLTTRIFFIRDTNFFIEHPTAIFWSFILNFLINMFPFSIFCFMGFTKKRDIFSYWFLFIIPVFLFEFFIPYYYNLIIPAVAVLSARALPRMDRKIGLILVLLIIANATYNNFEIIKVWRLKEEPVAYVQIYDIIKIANISSTKRNVSLMFFSPTFVFYYNYFWGVAQNASQNFHNSLSIYWKKISLQTNSTINENFVLNASNFKNCGNVTEIGNEYWLGKTNKALCANPKSNIEWIVVRVRDYAKTASAFSKLNYYPYYITSSIILLKKI